MALKVAPISGDRRFLPANAGSLGFYAKSAATPRETMADTPADDGGRRAAFEGFKWSMQRAAQGLLNDSLEGKDSTGRPIKKYVNRVAMCHRGTQGGGDVEVKVSRDKSRAAFGGLQTCGSVWHCPICAEKITAARRDELNGMITAWRAQGGHVYLATFTFHHQHGDDLAELLQLQRAALRKLKGHRSYKRAMTAAGSIGSVRALEVTCGGMNGFHPHTHQLIFAQPGHEQALRRRLRKVWARVLWNDGMSGVDQSAPAATRRQQITDFLKHCCDVRGGQHAAEYVAKFGKEPLTASGGRWGIGSEMTRGHQKIEKRYGGRTPFALLRDYLEGDETSGRLFRVYAVAFKGQRQLYYSPKLKEKIGYTEPELSDEEIAAQADTRCTERVTSINENDWRHVIASNARFEVLELARIHGAAAVRELIEELRHRRHRYSGEFHLDLSWWRPPTYYETPSGTRVLYTGR